MHTFAHYYTTPTHSKILFHTIIVYDQQLAALRWCKHLGVITGKHDAKALIHFNQLIPEQQNVNTLLSVCPWSEGYQPSSCYAVVLT